MWRFIIRGFKTFCIIFRLKNFVVVEMDSLRSYLRGLPKKGDADPIMEVTEFLDRISPWCDERKHLDDFIQEVWALSLYDKSGRFSSLKTYLEEILQILITLNRNKKGFNRTEPGEKVTDEKVFISNENSLLPVSVWKKIGDGLSYKAACKDAQEILDYGCEIERLLDDLEEELFHYEP